MLRRYLLHLYDGTRQTFDAVNLKEVIKAMFAFTNYRHLDFDIIEKCLSGFEDNDALMIYVFNALIEHFDEDHQIEYAAIIAVEIYDGE